MPPSSPITPHTPSSLSLSLSTMWERTCGCILATVLLLGVVTAQSSSSPRSTSPWLTLSGNAPVVIAKGGFSGLFPDSSSNAYNFAYIAGSPDTVSWCDVQLTKDGVGVCLPDIKLNNSTNILTIYPDGRNDYVINGVQTPGWFSVDYTMNELSEVSLIQGIYSRSDKFDAGFPILSVEDVETMIKPPVLWLNIEHDMFYGQHNLSMRSYLLSLSRHVVVNYISSPAVGFLKSIVPRLKESKTKLVFRFLGEDKIEPTMNLTYGSLLKNLTFVKSFASGILVPKHYIWPVTPDLYLQPHTSLVLDAHTEGLEVYAADFANDALFSYNYSSDPLAEYLSFVDNGIFSVDGVLTDFPITASETIGCFSHTDKNISGHEKPLIISHNGASGVYPDCTDLAYEQAIGDAADLIDCTVQITQDGILICMSSINLMETTTVTNSPFRSRTSVIPELQDTAGIFTFNLTWEEIQRNLMPIISIPDRNYDLVRNPRHKNAGRFMKLTDFLAFAKDKSLSGVLISIEHAAFFAEKLGISVTDAIIGAVEESGYSNQTAQEVMIQSTNSSVLIKFKQQTNYKLVYMIDESIRDADKSSIADIKRFAHSVAIGKNSVYPVTRLFITTQTELVKNLQSAGLSVYVYLLRNEFVSQAWDFFSDPIVEINSFVQGAGVDGIITDFPGTASAYKRNACSKMGDKAPSFMSPAEVGGLLQLINPNVQPPALAPFPVLDLSDVVEPPLPPASLKPSTPTAPSAQPSGVQRSCVASSLISLPMILASLLLI